MIGFPDDHQEQHTTSELVALYKAGTIDDECFVWRDGMNDWLSPFDVPEVADALKSAGLSRRSAQAPLNDEEDEATRVAPSPFDMEAPEPPAPAPAPVEAKPAFVSPAAAKPWAKAATEPKGATQPKLAATPKPSPADAPRAAVQPKPVAARRAAADRGAIDLFGAVDDAAGSEEDVAPNVAADEHAQKMTGARNESSVLFSLDQLTKLDKPKPKDKKKAESAAAAELFGDSSPNSLMNVGGGGLGILAAPDFTRPAAPAPELIREVAEPHAAAPARGGSLWIGVGIGVAVALVGGGVVVFGLGKKTDAADKTASTATAAPLASAKPEAAANATPSATPSAPAESASSEPTAPATSASAVASAVNKPAAPTAAGAGATPAAATPGGAKPADAKKPESPAPAAGGADFDRAAAVTSLGAAAANAASCRKAEGPFGSGKASVTFAPSGRATQANITGAFAGTEVGGCVARLFRSARVPPFGGDPVTVSKSFSIE
jgi:hypothetical protein